jgi:hypothetical protein
MITTETPKTGDSKKENPLILIEPKKDHELARLLMTPASINSTIEFLDLSNLLSHVTKELFRVNAATAQEHERLKLDALGNYGRDSSCTRGYMEYKMPIYDQKIRLADLSVLYTGSLLHLTLMPTRPQYDKRINPIRKGIISYLMKKTLS